LSSMEASGIGEAQFQPIAKAKGWQPPLTYLIAWRNLVHDRMRFAVTLTGIAFSTLLMAIQLGMLLNFMHTTSILVDHAGADLWITAHGVRTVDLATPLEERRRFQALKVDGVAAAEPYLLGFGFWKRMDGVRETVILIGINPDATMGKPWNLTTGADARDLILSPDGAVVDELYAEKLSVESVGQLFEINDHRVRVAGFTSGIRTFTQSPYVFMSLRHARSMAFAHETDPLTYILVRVADGYSPQAVARELQAKLPGADVLTAEEFSQRSRNYWLFSTGAGITVISGALLALFVGAVIAAQTLYASTMDRLPEYATIRAMGGPRSYLYAIVLKQALIGGLLGYIVGMSISLVMIYLGRNESASPEMTPWLALGIFGAIELMSAAASIVSLNKVTSIDPVEVFR
jgi:putative ABC transport system permease protein